MIKKLVAAAAALSLVGCASVLNDTDHGIRIDTKTSSGQVIEGADCRVSNDYGSRMLKSGKTQGVRRSARDLEISCSHAGQPEAQGIARSRANAQLAGNIIIGGVIGAVVDHSRGTGYTYPIWIEMVFGQSLVFDRAMETQGTVLRGYVAGSRPEKAEAGLYSAGNSIQCQQQLPGARCDGAALPQAATTGPAPVKPWAAPRQVGSASASSHACMHQLPGAKCD